jgi:hypothetical protein
MEKGPDQRMEKQPEWWTEKQPEERKQPEQGFP